MKKVFFLTFKLSTSLSHIVYLKGAPTSIMNFIEKKVILGGELYAGIYDSDSDYDSSHDSSSEEGMILLLYSC